MLRARLSVPRASRRGVIVMQSARLGGAGFVFRGQEGAHPGIHAEDGSGQSRLVLADAPGALHLFPVPVKDGLLVHVARLGSLPPAVERVALLRDGRTVVAVPGQAVGTNRDGTRAVVQDVTTGVLTAVDLAAGTTREVGRCRGGMHPMILPPPSLDEDGTRVLFADSDVEAGDGRLAMLDTRSGQVTELRPATSPPARATGTPQPDGGVLVVETATADGPRTRVRTWTPGGGGRVLLEWPRLSPVVPPVIADGVAYLLLAGEGTDAWPAGLVDVHAMDLADGTVRQLTHHGQLGGRFSHRGGIIRLEGGPVVVELTDDDVVQ